MLLLYLSNEAWHSLVVRSVRDRKAASSNLVASTMKKRAETLVFLIAALVAILA